jgi:predicted ribosomally synthesized peptide with SipW-like signal peptide
MRIKRTLQAAGLIAAAVILGLLTVQGTYALWSATAVASPGAVSSASFTVNLTAAPSGQVTTMTLPDGQPANVALTPGSALLPGTSVMAGWLSPTAPTPAEPSTLRPPLASPRWRTPRGDPWPNT